jgi:hypothetical protein
MPTVDKKTADNIAKYNGYFNGDDDNLLGDNPRTVQITKYTNAWGGESYGLTLEGRPNVYAQPTEYIINPTPYWNYTHATD